MDMKLKWSTKMYWKLYTIGIQVLSSILPEHMELIWFSLRHLEKTFERNWISHLFCPKLYPSIFACINISIWAYCIQHIFRLYANRTAVYAREYIRLINESIGIETNVFECKSALYSTSLFIAFQSNEYEFFFHLWNQNFNAQLKRIRKARKSIYLFKG